METTMRSEMHNGTTGSSRSAMKRTRTWLAVMAAMMGLLAFRAEGHADTWVQVNTPGFGNAANRDAWALTSFNGYLYTITDNLSGSKIWRAPLDRDYAWQDNTPLWSGVTRVLAMATFQNYLYAGTSNGQLWRTAGSSWVNVTPNPLGWLPGTEIESFARFGTQLCLSRHARVGVSPYQVWCSSDGTTWSQMLTPHGKSSPAQYATAKLLSTATLTAQGPLYVLYLATGHESASDTSVPGTEIWKIGRLGSAPLGSWQILNTPGFGNALNTVTASMAVVGSTLYVGTVNHCVYEVWSTDGVFPKTGGLPSWVKRYPAPLPPDILPLCGYPRAQQMTVLGGTLFVSESNNLRDGALVWRKDGSAWTPSNAPGFGNNGYRWINALTTSGSFVYASSKDQAAGVRIWKRLP